MSARTDLGLGIAAVALAGLYARHAAGMEDSLLSDAIGAGGVPMGIGALVGAAGAALALRALPGALAGSGGGTIEWHAHGKALGLLAILLGYVFLLPWIGYPLAILLLSIAVAFYAGARPDARLLGFGLGSAVVLWSAFVLLLRVPFPAARLLGF